MKRSEQIDRIPFEKGRDSSLDDGLVLWEGSTSPVVACVGNFPTVDDVFNVQPFTGEEGDLVKTALHQAGFRRSEVYFTNLLKYRPKKDHFRKAYAKAFLPYLRRELAIVRPQVVIAFGTDVNRFLLDEPDLRIKDHVGEFFSNVQGIAADVLAVYHPSYVLRTGGKRSRLFSEMVDHFKQIEK